MDFALEPGIFRHPRPKKAVLPPLIKKRNTGFKIEEISFDFNSREEYLTGFHKRKVARAKAAQAEAAKKLREERIIMRKKLREDRKKDLNLHVEAMNNVLQELNECTDDEIGHEDAKVAGWANSNPVPDLIDHEDKYVDEEEYISVTVEEVNVSKMGLSKTLDHSEDSPVDGHSSLNDDLKADKEKRWHKKPKKKFRYESKIERKLDRAKQKAAKWKRADYRKSD